jgi:hypothetical protein
VTFWFMSVVLVWLTVSRWDSENFCAIASTFSWSFKVYENHSVDIIYDLLEGVFNYDLSLILKYLISKGYLNALKIGNLTEEITRKHLDNKALHFSFSDMLSFIKFYKWQRSWMCSYLINDFKMLCNGL